MIIAILLLIVITIVKLWYDISKWKQHIQIKHTKEWLLLVIASLYSIYKLGSHLVIPKLWIISPKILEYGLSALLCSSFIWVFFNGFYNTIRGQNWWFLGDNNKNSSKIDKFLRMFPLWVRQVAQIGLLIITITLYIIFYG